MLIAALKTVFMEKLRFTQRLVSMEASVDATAAGMPTR
jgi:hypothetical protein